MQRVFVLDRERNPLMPCTPARARILLNKGKASVYRQFPFTIILKDRVGGNIQNLTFKVDPGSKISGLAIVAEFQNGKEAIWGANLEHKGNQIKESLLSRRQIRRSRRNRKTRYRQPRFSNRTRPKGWLAPSLMSRIKNILTWHSRLSKFSNIQNISMELVTFDTQKMDNPEISGVEYQQGELLGYEVREYLLEKWGRKCVYCEAENIPLEVEHIIPKSRGGSNRVSNLTLACNSCNIKKGNQTAGEFGYPEIQGKAKKTLKDAAVINSSRWALYNFLKNSDLPVEVGTGGRTKFNRISQGYTKDHWIDAACIGKSGEEVYISPLHIPLIIQSTGRGSRQMCRVNKFGFPRTTAKKQKRVQGFQTGDIVKAVVTKGKKEGTYIGKVAVRSSCSFNIKTNQETVQGISHKYCRLLHKSDGYNYTVSNRNSSPLKSKIMSGVSMRNAVSAKSSEVN